jgi:hypothetical protein
MGPEYNRVPSNRVHTLSLDVWIRSNDIARIKARPPTNKLVVPKVDEPTSKDLIDGDRVLALQALNKYQV